MTKLQCEPYNVQHNLRWAANSMVMPLNRRRRPRRQVRRSLGAALAVKAISGYQRHLSPRKGFACAHRIAYGGASCSQHIKTLIERHGLMQGAALAPERFRACREAYFVLRAADSGERSDDGERSPSKCRDAVDCMTCSEDDYSGSAGCMICSCLEATDDLINGCS